MPPELYFRLRVKGVIGAPRYRSTINKPDMQMPAFPNLTLSPAAER
jgi:hypothetical protein